MESSASPHDSAHDVGTLWTMRRAGQAARCALIARPRGWELRLLVDGRLVVAERCERGGETFTIAASIKEQMTREGWQTIVPQPMLRRVS